MPETRRPHDSGGLMQQTGTQAFATGGMNKGMGALRWQPVDPAFLGRRYSSDPRPFSFSTRHSLPTTFDEWSSDGDSSSEASVHQGFENLRQPRTPKLRVSSAANPTTIEEPARKTDDRADRLDVSRHSPQAVSQISTLSDVQSQHSAAAQPPAARRSPPPSEPSPPTSIDSLPAFPLPQRQPQQKPRAQFLRSPYWPSPDSSHRVREYPSSSRAESFRTAKEDIPTGTENSVVSTPVQLLTGDRLERHWLDSPTALAAANDNLEEVVVEPTPLLTGSKISDCSTPVPGDGASLPTLSAQASSTLDFDKHISYVCGSEDLDRHVESVADVSKWSVEEIPKGLGLSADYQSDQKKLSAEDVNNMVYQQLQAQNMKRYSGTSALPGAISASIVISAIDSTPKQLKRTTKRVSLRSGSNPFPATAVRNPTSPEGISPFKIRAPASKLDASPSMVETSIRNVSSPPHLGANALSMAAITLSSMQETPKGRDGSPRGLLDDDRPIKKRIIDANSQGSPHHAEHTLRHLSPGDRLSNNMSVRRTSLDTSPKIKVIDCFVDTDATDLMRMAKIEKNMVVKRKSPIEQQPLSDTEKPVSALSAPRIRGVVPSIASDNAEVLVEKPHSPHSLRRFSREERLENSLPSPTMSRGRRTSSSKRGDESRPLHSETFRSRSNDVSLGSPHSDVFFHVRSQSMSSDVKSSKAFDARFLYSNLTPLSMGQYSDTDISVQEANGIRIFSHNNHSIREVDLPQNSRPTSKGNELANMAPVTNAAVLVTPPQKQQPAFNAHVDPPTPKIGSSMPNGHVDSPLTNPRQAPQPPAIKFIPPTPVQDLAHPDGSDRAEAAAREGRPVPPPRQLSLLQRARNYSGNLLARTGSRRSSRHLIEEERPAHLSPMWQPEGFWNDVDSSDDEDGNEPYEPSSARLPPGGDTSDPGVNQRETFPRKMSRRLPGFRGTGGFLLGNSVGIDRHGTNNRRHCVSTGSRQLSHSASEELIRRKGLRQQANMSTGVPTGPGSLAPPTQNCNGDGGGDEGDQGSQASRSRWVGLQPLRTRVRALRLAREERAREKRRDELRERIGMRVYHQGRA